MAPEQQSERDAALRALLVDRVRPPEGASVVRRDRVRVGIVSGVVLALVVALSVIAIHLGAGVRTLPADSGMRTDGVLPTGSATSTDGPLPTPTEPPGVVLGRFSSADGPNQTHVIHPNGLALAESFACRGDGAYSVSLSHDSEFSSPDSCTGGGGGSGNKGHQGDVTVRVRTAATMRWTLIVSGIPETYVTPQPVVAPTDAAGAAVPFCRAAGLAARFDERAMPEGVTEAAGGEVRFTNRGSSACALAGWPMVLFSAEGGSGVLGHHTMAAIDSRMSTERGLAPVILKPGGHAWTQIDWYLPNYYPANRQGRCDPQTVHGLWIDLANSHAGSDQTGAVEVGIPAATACRNGPWGTDGKYGQISATEFVGYSLRDVRG